MVIRLLQSSIHDYGRERHPQHGFFNTDIVHQQPFDKFPLENGLCLTNGKRCKKVPLYRGDLMIDRQEGLTTTYNRFHNPKDKSADTNICASCTWKWTTQWPPLRLERPSTGAWLPRNPQGCATPSLKKPQGGSGGLLQLNHERYEEEVRQGCTRRIKRK